MRNWQEFKEKPTLNDIRHFTKRVIANIAMEIAKYYACEIHSITCRISENLGQWYVNVELWQDGKPRREVYFGVTWTYYNENDGTLRFIVRWDEFYFIKHTNPASIEWNAPFEEYESVVNLIKEDDIISSPSDTTTSSMAGEAFRTFKGVI